MKFAMECWVADRNVWNELRKEREEMDDRESEESESAEYSQ